MMKVSLFFQKNDLVKMPDGSLKLEHEFRSSASENGVREVYIYTDHIIFIDARQESHKVELSINECFRIEGD